MSRVTAFFSFMGIRITRIPVGIYLIAACTLLLTGRYTSGADSDTIWHLLAGNYMLNNHVILKTDIFSWTMLGKPWFPAEWLYEVVNSYLNLTFGVKSLLLLHLAGNAVQMTLLYKIGRRAGASSLWSAVVASLLTFAMYPYLTLRPQVFSYLLFTWMISILEQRGRKPYLVYLLPLLSLIWVNFHLSFILLILWVPFEWLMGFFSFSLARVQNTRIHGQKHLFLAWILAIAFSLLNPETYHVYPYVFSMSSNQDLKNNILEYLSPNFHNDLIFQGFLLPAAIIWLIALTTTRKISLKTALYMVGTFSLSLISIRYYPYFLICSALFLFPAGMELQQSIRLLDARLTRSFTDALSRWKWLRSRSLGWNTPLRNFLQVTRKGISRSYPAHVVVICLFVGVAVFQFPKDFKRGNWTEMEKDYPHGAVAYLQKHQLTSKVFNSYTWGGFFEMQGIPAFVDGRTDLFLQSSVFMDYIRITNLNSDTDSLLNFYDPNIIVMPAGSNVGTYLEHVSTYKEVYHDGSAVIFQKVNQKK